MEEHAKITYNLQLKKGGARQTTKEGLDIFSFTSRQVKLFAQSQD